MSDQFLHYDKGKGAEDYIGKASSVGVSVGVGMGVGMSVDVITGLVLLKIPS
jgi:hypothetical protein